MSYKIGTDCVLLDGAVIPADERNADYRTYLEWLQVGNSPEPISEPAREIQLTPSQQIILADGVDVARVTVSGDPGATIEYSVNSEPLAMVLDSNGQASIDLTCDTPSTTLLVQAGTARAVIYAVEVPA